MTQLSGEGGGEGEGEGRGSCATSEMLARRRGAGRTNRGWEVVVGVGGFATTADATAADREGGKNAGVLRQRGMN